jgi:hypothetical protein
MSTRDERRRELEELAAGPDGELQFLLECMDVLGDEMALQTPSDQRINAILDAEFPKHSDS